MNNPFDFFDRIYCINLKERTDKWQQCLEEFSRLNIQDKVIKFDAIKFTGELPPQYRWFNIRALGCTASHRQIIKICNRDNVKNVLVLEDDVEFHNEPIKNLALSVNELKNYPWDIFYLGMSPTNEKHEKPLERISENLLKVNCALTTHAIAYNNSSFKILLDTIPDGTDIVEWQMKNESYDGFLMRNFLSQNKAFCTNEYLATQRDSFSDINLGQACHGKAIMENFYRFRPA